MFAHSKLPAAAIAIAIALMGVATVPALTEKSAPAPVTQIDRTPTGSIEPASRPSCDPASPKSDYSCRITGGDPDAHYPFVPVNPAFGI